jgi:hypothetical protein
MVVGMAGVLTLIVGIIVATLAGHGGQGGIVVPTPSSSPTAAPPQTQGRSDINPAVGSQQATKPRTTPKTTPRAAAPKTNEAPVVVTTTTTTAARLPQGWPPCMTTGPFPGAGCMPTTRP